MTVIHFMAHESGNQLYEKKFGKRSMKIKKYRPVCYDAAGVLAFDVKFKNKTKQEAHGP